MAGFVVHRPPRGDAPFSVNVEIASCPWSPTHRLARIGLKGEEVKRESRRGTNLVFLIDVSGSMNQPNKLPLVKQSIALLSKNLTARDRVARRELLDVRRDLLLELTEDPGLGRNRDRIGRGRLAERGKNAQKDSVHGFLKYGGEGGIRTHGAV